jgi:hypothetical protein
MVGWQIMALKSALMAGIKGQWCDVGYNEAVCLHNAAIAVKDNDESRELVNMGRHVLEDILNRDPNLDGPETVTRYRELLERLGPP